MMANNEDDNNSASIATMIENARVDTHHAIGAHPMANLYLTLKHFVEIYPEVVVPDEPACLKYLDQAMYEVEEIANEAKQEAVNGNFPLAVGLASRMYEVVEAAYAATHENPRLVQDYIEASLQALVDSPASLVDTPEMAAVTQAIADSFEGFELTGPRTDGYGGAEHLESLSMRRNFANAPPTNEERLERLVKLDRLAEKIVIKLETSNVLDQYEMNCIDHLHVDYKFTDRLGLARSDWNEKPPAEQAAALATLVAMETAAAAAAAAAEPGAAAALAAHRAARAVSRMALDDE